MNMNIPLDSLLAMDVMGGKPSLMPGDMIETIDGHIGVIAGAEVIVNGGRVNWNEELPEIIEHGNLPAYSVELKDRGAGKYAWWTATEFKRVVALSPMRSGQ